MSILEWLVALSPIIIAIATVVYVTFTYLLLREQRREKKKPVLEEMLKVVISPLLKDVQSEIRSLRQKRFEWKHVSKTLTCHELEPRKRGAEEIVYENLAKACPRISVLLNHHDVEFHYLKNSLENLANKLLSVGFEKRCMELITEYNRGIKRAILSGSDVDYLLMYVIDNTKEINERNVNYEFWNTHGAELLSFREKVDVKEHIETVESKARELLRTCRKLEADLKQLMNQFWEKYGIKIAES